MSPGLPSTSTATTVTTAPSANIADRRRGTNERSGSFWYRTFCFGSVEMSEIASDEPSLDELERAVDWAVVQLDVLKKRTNVIAAGLREIERGSDWEAAAAARHKRLFLERRLQAMIL